MKVSAADMLDLTVAERIQLVAEIWESVAACPNEIEITEPTRRLIKKRLEAHRTDPNAGSPWEEVKNRILPR